jgi:hypothetical protein
MLSSLKTARDRWKFRLRMAIALRDAAPGSAAPPAELDRLVALQTAYWQGHPPLVGADAQQALHELNNRSISAFVLSIRGRNVRLWKKPAVSFPADQEDRLRLEQSSFLKRAMFYRAFFEKVIRRSRAEISIDLAIDVADMPEDSADIPIVSFQKLRGAHNPLIPDVDFFHSKWYRKEHDALRYQDKSASACFVGSSTGGWLSAEEVRHHGTPRLHAAAYFHGNPKVIFRIAKAVQCLSEEAKALLTSQPYFCSYVSWEDQLQHRFILSMDGNGAACSRLVKGLMCNGVVIKFDSPYELYYFPALRAGSDYLLAENEQDVERLVDIETAHPGTFKEVAVSGQQFAAQYLGIRSVMDYTARLLTALAALNRN